MGPELSDFPSVVRDLVLGNKARIFPDIHGSIDILDVELGRPRFIRDDRYHCRVTVHYRSDGSTKSMRMWLKFRPQLHTLLPILDAYHERLSGQVFPKTYFAWCAPNENTAVLATAYVRGATLRSRLLTLAALRQTFRLFPIFRSNGTKMRRFHDAFAGAESIEVAPLVDSTADLIRETAYFATSEKASVRAHLERYAHILAVRTLPTVQVHNDWILRNIMVAADGVDYVIDCDSMRAQTNLRWLDVAYFLLNLDSQLKWSPLVTAEMLADLGREFWRGYAGEFLPDKLTPEQVIAILYILRLRCLLGGTTRPAYFKVMGGRFDHRVLPSLKESVVTGRAVLSDLWQYDMTEMRPIMEVRGA
ncbi:unnamed protein product [uncultured bacterium]|nr:unnamed protein product [uncultured bacterium]